MILKFDSFTKKPFRIGFFGNVTCEIDQIGTVVNSDPFTHIQRWMNTLDYRVVSLETTFSGYESDFPRLSSSDIFVPYLKKEFDLLLMANEHAFDGGPSGVIRTNKILDEYGISHIGTGSLDRPRKTFDLKLNGFDITFLNYTTYTNEGQREKTESDLKITDTQTIPEGIISFYDEAEIKEKIDIAKKRSELIVSAIHQRDPKGIADAGHFSTDSQKELLESILDMGSNIIIGTHSCDFQGGRIYSNDNIITYALGNFFSNIVGKKKSISSGCVMIASSDSYQNIRYTFLPTCTYQTQGFSFVLPLAPVEMGAYPFIKEDDRKRMIEKLQEIREVLSTCSLEEEVIQPQFL